MNNKNFPIIIGSIIILVVLGAGATIPFYFESPSIFYKIGMDKLMLRTGKIFGITASLLMVVQLILIARFSRLENIFSLKRLYKYHRINGIILLCTALIHPLLILGADHFVLFGLEYKYLPELIGVLLLLILAAFILISFFQKKLGLNYKLWRRFHKIVAPGILILMFFHVFNVSKSFEAGPPFYALSVLGIISVLLFTKKYLY